MKQSVVEQGIIADICTKTSLTEDQIRDGYKSLTSMINGLGVHLCRAISNEQTEEILKKFFLRLDTEPNLRAGL
jgi:hypothetical protein